MALVTTTTARRRRFRSSIVASDGDSERNKKKPAPKRSDDDDDDDDDDDLEERVFRKGTTLFFGVDVTNKSIARLRAVLDEAADEALKLRNALVTPKILLNITSAEWGTPAAVEYTRISRFSRWIPLAALGSEDWCDPVIYR